MTESAPPERPARKWLVITASVALVVGALALVLWTTAPEPPVRVVYHVTGTAARVTVTYSTFHGAQTRQEETAALPWRMELFATGEPEHGVLTVTIGPDGGDVACEVRVAEVVRRSATATGAHTSALCDF
ncbi:MmpS family membrane protein [Saccharothrix saharensis]|uniref:MmpS family membrane protein n=1 Tax=Saccharothrix saharensis TaxID=571190 RepID=A0A543JHY0_9PSEU|nr:MmpS family transport accessory protein [Saccharothrix saharensis]TQM82458.1 MmpS family membrane protein [Saccharothrix saharensis]